MENMELLHSEGTEHNNNNGLNTWQAAIVIAGVTFGSGVIILPHNIQISGAYGLFFNLIVPFIVFYGMHKLSKCWTLAVQIAKPIDPITKIQISRSPYPFIGFICYGKYVRIVLRVLVTLNNFGTAMIVFIIATEITQHLFVNLGMEYSICIWLIILSLGLIPLLWFDTPKDVWLLELIALVLTVVSLCLIFTIFANGRTDEASTVSTYRNISSKTIQLTFSSVLYAYSAASLIPTIQADMKNPENFTYSLVAGVLVMYVGMASLSIVSYFNNPPNVNKNVLLSLQSESIRSTAFSLMAFHLLFSCVLCLNPVNQEFEDLLRIEPRK
ncbi:Uncharacterised protein g11111 [Pycnogonum litorale]